MPEHDDTSCLQLAFKEREAVEKANHVIPGADQTGFSKQDKGRLGLPGDRQQGGKVSVGRNQDPISPAGAFHDDGNLGRMQPVV